LIFRDFLKAFEQVVEPELRSVLIRAILLTIIALVLAAWGLRELLIWTLGDWSRNFGIANWIGNEFVGVFFSAAAIFSTMAFLALPVTSAVIGLFADEIAGAVERKHYPGLGFPKEMSRIAQIAGSLKFFLLVSAANLIALAAYLAVPPLAPVIFLAMNGYLIGREYYTLCAELRVSKDDTDSIRRRNRIAIWLEGSAVAFLLSIPILNLVVPLVGIAAFTHAFHRFRVAEARL